MKSKQLLFSLLVLLSLNHFSLSAQNKFPTTVGSNVEIDGGSIKLYRPAASGSWARGLLFYNAKTDNEWAGIGLYGTAETVNSIYIGHGNDPWWGNKGIHILANGNTGIGTTGPNAKFVVIGQDVNFYSNTTTNTFNIGRNANETFKLYVTDGSGFIDYMQDADDNGTHTLYIRNLAGGTSYNNDIRFQAGGYDRLSIKPDGNIGIGTNSPDKKLDVIGTPVNGNYTSLLRVATNNIAYSGSGGAIELGAYNNRGGMDPIALIAAHLSDGTANNQAGHLKFYTSNQGVLNEQVRILADGNVGIGTTTPTNKLEVNGTIRSKEIKVEATPWPDYVFTKEHELPNLQEVNTYIQQNGHLPEIPTAKEVEENGISLGEMNAKLLQKIEELMLYVIELKEENVNQSKKIEKLSERIFQIELTKSELK